MLFPSSISILLPLLAGAGTGSSLALPLPLPISISIPHPLANSNSNPSLDAIPRMERYHQLVQKPLFPQLAELFKSPLPLSISRPKPSSSSSSGTSITGPKHAHHIQPQRQKQRPASTEASGSSTVDSYQTTSESESEAGSKGRARTKTRIHPSPPENHHRLDKCVFRASESSSSFSNSNNNNNNGNGNGNAQSNEGNKLLQSEEAEETTLLPAAAAAPAAPRIPSRKHNAFSTVLLSRATEMLTSPSHRRRNLMKTVHLGAAMEERRLENVFLGLAYTRAEGGAAPAVTVARDEVEEREMEEQERDVMDCLAEAVWALQEPDGMMTDGVWDVPDGRGRLSFLIWRTD